MEPRNYRIGFLTLDEEFNLENLPVRGTLPPWLAGTLVRTGPTKFEVGKRTYHHWFDGLAMLHRFSFQGGAVSYANRFLESRSYLEAKVKGEIALPEFATDPCRSLFDWVRSIFFPDPDHSPDNGNVNISFLAGHCVALTETPHPVAFNPQTLRTTGTLDFADSLQGQHTTAHPHFDFDRNEAISYMTHLSQNSVYHVYRLGFGERRRRLIATIPAPEPSYMHTFALTENFVVLAEIPLVADPLAFALKGKPFIENYRWKPERGTRFLVIRREDGAVVATCESEAFFTFHHVNAFERDNEIVLDLIAYPDNAIIDGLYLPEVRNMTDRVVISGQLRRYRLPLAGSAVSYEALSDELIDLPRINYRQCNTRDYQYVYGVSTRLPHNFHDSLVKTDVRLGKSKVWEEAGCYPGEPVFVAAPGASEEDEGAILSVVLDARRGNSFLLVLDAHSFEERARAEVPHAIPFLLHGQFFEEATRPV